MVAVEEVLPAGHVDDAERCSRCGQPVGVVDSACPACGRALVSLPELPVGSSLGDGRYAIDAVIGRGGFGITYQAIDRRLHRRVAIKELFPEQASRDGSQVLVSADAREAFRAARDRFLREARVLARFTHPGIVRVYEVFEEHGTAYLVMELLGGCTLVDVMRARGAAFTEDEVLDVAGRVAAALRPVHAAGVLHRDLNPSNVMLTEHGRIVLIDFGLARDFDPAQTMGMTRVVTPGYAPMEQYHGEGRFGPATDVYGLAATLYRLATGRVPVPAIARDAGEALPAPHRLNPAISKRVSDAILDGVELDPSHRPQDLDSFLARLGVRHLPDGPRSILLGSPGAEPERLRASGGHVSTIDAEAEPPASPDVPDVPDERTEAMSGSVLADTSMDPRSPAAPPAEPHIVSPPEPPDPDLTEVGPARTDGVRVGLDRTRRASTPSARLAGGPDGGATALLAGAEPAVAAPHSLLGEAGRRKVTVPLAVVAVALGAAAPVLAAALLVLVVLPVLASIGDLRARRHRIDLGVASGWAQTSAPPAVVAPTRFVRNVVVSVVRCSPVLGVGAVLLGLWYLLGETSISTGVLDVLLRLIGGGTAGALLAASAQGSARFRSGLGLDVIVDRAAPGGRTDQRLVVGWIVVAALVCAALWLDPSPFPLP